MQDIAESDLCSKITAIWHNHVVYDRTEWNKGDAEVPWPKIRSGGTSHRDVFNCLEDDPAMADVRAVVCLTDCYTSYPDREPDVPVIWVGIDTTWDIVNRAPFGEGVLVDDDDLH